VYILKDKKRGGGGGVQGLFLFNMEDI